MHSQHAIGKQPVRVHVLTERFRTAFHIADERNGDEYVY